MLVKCRAALLLHQRVQPPGHPPPPVAPLEIRRTVSGFSDVMRNSGGSQACSEWFYSESFFGRGAVGCRALDRSGKGLQVAELAAAWNPRKRERRGTEDRAFHNEILRIAQSLRIRRAGNRPWDAMRWRGVFARAPDIATESMTATLASGEPVSGDQISGGRASRARTVFAHMQRVRSPGLCFFHSSASSNPSFTWQRVRSPGRASVMQV
jgi:hypothetical protein